ncbi:MAG: UDP binding domain-containing protein, partial [Elusimicrobiota bacterium]
EKKIAVLGLAFKADTDDMRNAPSIDIIKQLCREGALIKAYDPEAVENAREVLPDSVKYFKNLYEAARDCDLMLILTDWDEIKNIDLQKIKKILKKPPSVVDGRNIFDPLEMEKEGFNYTGIGR